MIGTFFSFYSIFSWFIYTGIFSSLCSVLSALSYVIVTILVLYEITRKARNRVDTITYLKWAFLIIIIPMVITPIYIIKRKKILGKI